MKRITQLWKKLNDSKVFWAVVAFLVAVVIWYNMKEEATDTIQRSFDIPVTYSGETAMLEERQLVVTGRYEGTVHVVLVGPRKIMKELTADDVYATMDLNEIKQASNYTLQYSITYRDGIDTSGITVASTSPGTVNFSVSKWVQKTLEVRGSFDYSLPGGYTAAGITFEPSQITVEGPETYVSNISYAWVSFGEDNVESTYSAQAQVVLKDYDGNDYYSDHVTMDVSSVKATLEVKATKAVPVTVNFIYGGGATEANVKYTVDPETVQLSGDAGILSGLNKIVLTTIDLRDFNSSMTQKFPILIDSALSNDTNIFEATVTVEILDPLSTGSYTVTNLSCINVTEGYAADFITKQLEVVLRGTADDIQNVTADNIRVVADLKDVNTTTGNIEVPVQIYVDGYPNVGVLHDDYTVTIQVRKAK